MEEDGEEEKSLQNAISDLSVARRTRSKTSSRSALPSKQGAAPLRRKRRAIAPLTRRQSPSLAINKNGTIPLAREEIARSHLKLMVLSFRVTLFSSSRWLCLLARVIISSQPTQMIPLPPSSPPVFGGQSPSSPVKGVSIYLAIPIYLFRLPFAHGLHPPTALIVSWPSATSFVVGKPVGTEPH
jgi:hypothetical protein